MMHADDYFDRINRMDRIVCRLHPVDPVDPVKLLILSCPNVVWRDFANVVNRKGWELTSLRPLRLCERLL
jgi:hypothetical protein